MSSATENPVRSRTTIYKTKRRDWTSSRTGPSYGTLRATESAQSVRARSQVPRWSGQSEMAKLALPCINFKPPQYANGVYVSTIRTLVVCIFHMQIADIVCVHYNKCVLVSKTCVQMRSMPTLDLAVVV